MEKLKHFLIAILALALTVCLHTPVVAEAPAQLTQKGHELLEEGKPQEAFKVWGKALNDYERDQNQAAILGTKINQSLALSAMGQNPRACSTLATALELEEWICDTQESPKVERIAQAINAVPTQFVTLLGLQTLGDTLQKIGKTEEAVITLKSALTKASTTEVDTTDMQLSLANAYTSFYRQRLNQYQLSESYRSFADPDQSLNESSTSALALYKTVSANPNPSLSLKARLNWLELTQALDPTVPQLQELQSHTQKQIPPVVRQIQQTDFKALSPNESIYARLKFSNSLMSLEQDLELAGEYIQTATQTAESLHNKRAIAASAFYSGKLHKQMGEPLQAEQDLKKGASLATSIQAWDLAYQSHAELAKLLQENGDISQSRQAYQSAISNLEQVRSNLLNVDHPFSFREEIEPIHRKYMQLLLSMTNPDLKSVITTNEQLQIAQVENFLRCGRLDVVSLEELREETETPTVIHILQLGDQIETLVSTDQGIFRHSAPAAPIIEQLGFLSINIETAFDRTGAVVLDYASALYDELITPIQPYLPDSGTLVFVLDGDFQGIPMAMLWDGQKFLIETYSIANALGSKVARPQPLPPKDLKVLFAGLSKISPSQQESNQFVPEQSLPFVAEEVKQVGTYSDTNLLINDAFTSERFQNTLNQTDVPILHISTHGQFSSRIEDTLIWAWDQPITLKEMEAILRRKGDSEPLNLLVLSACETAEGDRRATLGLAGIAAQVGARSTLASLWIVDDSSTATFMANFYEQLQEGKTKAAALRTAQLSLINSDNYRHPFYWASFILVGSWV